MDVVAGAAVGWSETIIGFPFLTVKCLQQNNQKSKNRKSVQSNKPLAHQVFSVYKYF